MLSIVEDVIQSSTGAYFYVPLGSFGFLAAVSVYKQRSITLTMPPCPAIPYHASLYHTYTIPFNKQTNNPLRFRGNVLPCMNGMDAVLL